METLTFVEIFQTILYIELGSILLLLLLIFLNSVLYDYYERGTERNRMKKIQIIVYITLIPIIVVLLFLTYSHPEIFYTKIFEIGFIIFIFAFILYLYFLNYFIDF